MFVDNLYLEEYYIGAVSGTVMILTGTEAAVPAMEGVLAALTIE